MLLLSIHPRFADAIFAGTKKVELRRRAPRIAKGDEVLVYSTIPTAAVIGTFTVENVTETRLESLWRRTRATAAVTREQFDSYFDGLETGFGIWVSHVRPFELPISLWSLRNLWPGFHPPQGFRYLTPQEVEMLLEPTVRSARSNAA
jgi:predicted transcriptional regulator